MNAHTNKALIRCRVHITQESNYYKCFIFIDKSQKYCLCFLYCSNWVILLLFIVIFVLYFYSFHGDSKYTIAKLRLIPVTTLEGLDK